MNKRIGDRYVNKMYAANEAVMDITDVNVDASQVLAVNSVSAEDNYFYLATGERVQGSCTYDADTRDATATASEILATKSGYVGGQKITGTMPNNGEATKTITATTDGANIPLDYGYYANGSHIAVTGLTPAEIKEGVTYFGVTGTLSPEMPTEHGTATTLYLNQQTYNPTAGSLYDNFTVFGWNDIHSYEENSAGGYTLTINFSANPT